MRAVNILIQIFLWPGTVALKAVGITVDEDGGIFRSLVNMLFWGAMLTPLVLVLVLRGTA